MPHYVIKKYSLNDQYISEKKSRRTIKDGRDIFKTFGCFFILKKLRPDFLSEKKKKVVTMKDQIRGAAVAIFLCLV